MRGCLNDYEAFLLEIEDDIDIIMLTETWLHDVEPLPWIPGFEVSFGAARPRSTKAAGYGGVAIYIRQDLVRKVSVWRVRESDGVIWIRCHAAEGAITQFFCCCYVAPDGCPGCPEDVGEWFETLENEISEARGLGEVLVAGDFNARIGTAPDFNRLDAAGNSTSTGADRRIMEEDFASTCRPRSSVDKHVSARGRRLLQLCELTGLRVVNGRVAGDIPAAATSLGSHRNGKSVIDLFLACPRVFGRIDSLKVGGKLTQGADHLAVAVSINEFMEIPLDQEAAADEDGVEVNSTSESNADHEFIIEHLLLPAFVEAVAAAAPELKQICVEARDAAESENTAMVEKAVAGFLQVISDACATAGMKRKGSMTDKDRWVKKVKRLPLAVRQQRREFRQQSRKSVRACKIAEASEIRKRLKELT